MTHACRPVQGSKIERSEGMDEADLRSKLQLVLLDFGLAEELTPTVRYRFLSFLHSIAGGKGRQAGEHMLHMGQNAKCPDKQGFLRNMAVLFREHCDIQAPGGIDVDKVGLPFTVSRPCPPPERYLRRSFHAHCQSVRQINVRMNVAQTDFLLSSFTLDKSSMCCMWTRLYSAECQTSQPCWERQGRCVGSMVTSSPPSPADNEETCGAPPFPAPPHPPCLVAGTGLSFIAHPATCLDQHD